MRQAPDIVLGGIPLTLERKLARQGRFRHGADIPGETDPASEQEPFRRPQTRTYTDFSGGMGASRRLRGLDNMYAYALGAYTRSPGLVMPAGEIIETPLPGGLSPAAGRCNASVEYNGNLEMGFGPYVFSIPGGVPGTPAVSGFVSTDPTTQIYSMVTFNGKAYLGTRAGGIPAAMSVKDGSAAWSASGTVFRQHLATLWVVTSDGLGAWRMVGTDGDSSFRFVSGDPMNIADWGAQYRVGNSSYGINSIAASNRALYFVKTNGIHEVDGRGYSPNLTPYWEHTYHDLNGQRSIVHDGQIFASHIQGLDRVDVSSHLREDEPGFCHPGASTGLPNETPIWGRAVAMCESGDGWLCVAFRPSIPFADSFICYGRDRRKLGIDGPGSMVWHGAEARFVGHEVTHMTVSNLTGRPYLWLATTDNLHGGIPRLYAQSLPQASSPLQDWLNGGTHRFQESFSVYLPTDDGDDPLAIKSLSGFEFSADNIGADVPNFCELYSRADAGDWVRQVYASAGSYARAEAQDGSSGYRIGLRIDGHGSKYWPPVWRALKQRHYLLPRSSTVRSYTCVIGPAVAGQGGQADTRDPWAVWEQIQNLADATPVELVDHLGRIYTAQVLPGFRHDWFQHELDADYSLRTVINIELKSGPKRRVGDGAAVGFAGLRAG